MPNDYAGLSSSDEFIAALRKGIVNTAGATAKSKPLKLGAFDHLFDLATLVALSKVPERIRGAVNRRAGNLHILMCG